MTLRHPVNQAHVDEATLGERVADKAVATLGSWTFIFGQTVVMACWVLFNSLAFTGAVHFDKFPFILLNLGLSTQAGIAGPLILLASKRSDAKNRDTLDHDYACTQQVLAKLDANTTATLAIARAIKAIARAVKADIEAS